MYATLNAHLSWWLHVSTRPARLLRCLSVCHDGCTCATLVARVLRLLRVCYAGCTYATMVARVLRWLHVHYACCTSARLVARLPRSRNKGGGYTLAGRRGGWGVNILEDERNRIALLQQNMYSVLYCICKQFRSPVIDSARLGIDFWTP